MTGNVTFGDANYFLDPWMVAIYYVILHTESFLALTTNLCTLTVIVKYIHQVTQSYLLIASLAISDLCSVVLAPLCAVLPLLEGSRTWFHVCLIYQFFNLVFTYVGLANILLITIDRYLYILKPLRYDLLFPTSRVKIFIISVWIFIILETVFFISFMNK